MTPKEITTLAHHRLVPPWVMKLVLEATAIERANTIEEAAKVCEGYALESMEAFNRTGHDFEDGQVNGGYGCAAAIRGLK